MTSQETRAAAVVATVTATHYTVHARHCFHCSRSAPNCKTGSELWESKTLAATELAYQRVLDKAPMEGQAALW